LITAFGLRFVNPVYFFFNLIVVGFLEGSATNNCYEIVLSYAIISALLSPFFFLLSLLLLKPLSFWGVELSDLPNWKFFSELFLSTSSTIAKGSCTDYANLFVLLVNKFKKYFKLILCWNKFLPSENSIFYFGAVHFLGAVFLIRIHLF